MFCPICKSEYRRGVTQCNDCGVSLVDKLEFTSSTGAVSEDEEPLAPIWSGDDPREFAAVKEALDKADIAYNDRSATGYFIFPSLRPKMEIRVLQTDAPRAQEIVRNLLGDLSPANSQEAASAESPADTYGDSAYSAGIAGGDDDTADDVEPEYASAELDEEEAISEVWSGEAAEFAAMLVACFRENGIASRSLSQNGRTRLLVRPEDEPRAKEIVREVIEGTPLE